MTNARFALATVAALAFAAPLAAQSADAPGNDQPKRTRITAGAQLVPSYPGADDTSIQPLLGLSFAKAGKDFAFSSADQGFGFNLFNSNGFSVGPVVALQGERKRKDTGGALPKVGFSVEAGGFAQYEFSSFRLRGEVRQGVSGHKATIGVLSADFVARDHDNWLFAIGPRATWSSAKYQRAYFGVPVAVPALGLTAYRPGSGFSSVGAAANALYALSPRWGLTGYAKYDRLVGDAGRSPLVRSSLGDRNQLSGGVGLTYTF